MYVRSTGSTTINPATFNPAVSDYRGVKYTQRVAAPWNSLPKHIIDSKNVAQFKVSYDKYIKST